MNTPLINYKQLELDAVLEITQAINRNTSAVDLCKIYGFTLRAHMGVQRMAVVYLDDPDWELLMIQGLKEDFIQLNEIDQWCNADEEISLLKDTDLRIRKEFDVLLPVRHKGRCIAFVLIGNLNEIKERQLPVSFDEKIKFIQTVTNIIIVAIENKRLFKKHVEQQAIQKEMELARKVQKMLIPADLPSTLDIAAIYRPHHSIGGDYYDVFELSPKNLLICMADVSGKGVGAALLMANFQALVRVLARESRSLTELVSILNERVEEITKGDRFITVFIALYNTETKELSYINAGHPPPIVCKKNGIEELSKGCIILGAFPDLIKVEEGRLSLEDDSILLIYTDGLTELSNSKGELFNEDRLYEFATKNQELSPDDFLDSLISEMNAFKREEPYSDDISVLCWKISA